MTHLSDKAGDKYAPFEKNINHTHDHTIGIKRIMVSNTQMQLLRALFYAVNTWLLFVPTTATATPPVQLELQQVAEGVYVRQGQNKVVFAAKNIANIGAIVGHRCIAIVDTGGSLEEGWALRRAIEKISSLSICYVINTHAHPDHFLGNGAFTDIEGLEFVGHQNMAQSAEAAKNTWLERLSTQRGSAATEADWIMPTQTIDSPTTLDLGEHTLQLQPFSTAHSHSDITVFDQKTSTLWLSDLLFVEHTPVLAGSLPGWIDALTELPIQQAKHIIPGHGPVQLEQPAEAIQTQLDYLKKLHSEITHRIEQGESLYEVQAEAKRQHHEHWTLYEQYHARNIARAWAELEWAD